MGKISMAEIMKVMSTANANRPSVYYGDKVFTWKETAERSNQFYNALMDRGLEKFDKTAAC